MYHYTDSGLDNVVLESGYREVNTEYGNGVSIDNLDALHLAIGKQKQLIEPGQGRTPMGNDNRDAAPRAHRVDCLRQGGVARLTGVLFTQEHIFDASADAGCQWNCLSARW